MPTMKQLRQDAGLTAFQLAYMAGVSLSSINRMEQGKKPVTRLTAGKVIHALSRHIGRLITLQDIEGLVIAEEDNIQ